MDIPGWASTAFFLLDVAIVVILVPRIISQRRESAATLAWVLFILLLPVLGAGLYHLFGTRRMKRKRLLRAKARERIADVSATVRKVLGPFHVQVDGAQQDDPLAAAARTFNFDRAAATTGNELTVLHHGNLLFRAIEAEIAAAQSYIHVEFYIFHPDRTGLRIIELLEERARAGVEVRLLVDAVGARELKHRHVSKLLAAGGKFAQFLPVNIWARPFSVNFRNHRKIVVIDGVTAFTGGMNVGDEYRGRDPEIGNWRDTHVMIRGPVALKLQEIFADDWHFSTGEQTVSERYYPVPQRPGASLVEVVASGPDATAEAIHRKLFNAITRADRRVWLTTPYFIPDRSIMVALMTAAERGVDVRLLLPGWSDHKFVLYAGRSHYLELLAAGARIFEYKRGMLHAKTMVVDDVWTTIGSANMDRRSFVLNWEANLIALDRLLACQMAERFEHDMKDAAEITLPLRRTPIQTFEEAACYILSPLL
jgi:cardiolipin synthase A/B